MLDWMKSKRRRNKDPAVAFLLSDDAHNTLAVHGYTRLSQNPEVQMAVNYIAELVSSMTIHLMENRENGDVRVRDGLARKVDIDPYSAGTRKSWMYNLVRNMLVEGNQVVQPITKGGYLEDLRPVPPSKASFVPQGDGYRIMIDGLPHDPWDLLHFLVNPDPDQPWKGMGYQVALKDLIENLKQATATKKGFMSSEYKPSAIILVDGNADALSSEEGRQEILKTYLQSSRAGAPWVLPGDLFKVEQMKPLTLNDLAINDTVTLDKKSVAGILGVPPFVVGAAPFNKEENRNFINTRIMPIAQIIQQELTKKLLTSPNRYFRLSSMALYSYDIQELAQVGQGLYVRGIMTGNEVRDWMNMSPREGLDELVMLENYIPAGMIGEQKKLNPKGGETDE